MRSHFIIYGRNLDGHNNESMFLKRALRKAGLRDAEGYWWTHKMPYFPKEAPPYVLMVGATSLHRLLPQANLVYCQGQPVKAHGRILYAIDHPFTILHAKQGYPNWERQLRLFASLLNDMQVNIRTIQDLTAHCMYCDKGKTTELTCHYHIKTLLRDRATNLVPPMVEPKLF